mmetsp:Transcript_11081/g.27233  ORF Transcript_11081/g.27233 Transcript_11081/m.27233 type:complete len:293 (+) Transcript_11081:596-1474(+)
MEPRLQVRRLQVPIHLRWRIWAEVFVETPHEHSVVQNRVLKQAVHLRHGLRTLRRRNGGEDLLFAVEDLHVAGRDLVGQLLVLLPIGRLADLVENRSEEVDPPLVHASPPCRVGLAHREELPELRELLEDLYVIRDEAVEDEERGRLLHHLLPREERLPGGLVLDAALVFRRRVKVEIGEHLLALLVRLLGAEAVEVQRAPRPLDVRKGLFLLLIISLVRLPAGLKDVLGSLEAVVGLSVPRRVQVEARDGDRVVHELLWIEVLRPVELPRHRQQQIPGTHRAVPEVPLDLR